MNGKNQRSEINIAPVPVCYRAQMRQWGLWYYSYYESVSCESPFTQETSHVHPFEFYCITQMLNGRGFYRSNDMSLQDLKRNDIVVAVKGTSVRYGSFQERYREDSVAFLGGTADMLKTSGVLQPGIYNLGSARWLLPIIEKIREATLPALLESTSRLQELIFALHHAAKQGNNRLEAHAARLDQLVTEIRKDLTHWWSVPEMAAFCNVSENYLRMLFHQIMGLSPKQYMDNLRLTRGAELLASTSHPMEEIARSLGYVDPYHFMRRFAQIMGMPPARYRRQARNLNR